jgi:hypothetical protein
MFGRALRGKLCGWLFVDFSLIAIDQRRVRWIVWKGCQKCLWVEVGHFSTMLMRFIDRDWDFVVIEFP